MQLSLPQQIAIWTLPILFAITFHEVAHGWVALRYGDQTAKLSGRLTLNPIKHIDLVGTIIVPLILVSLGGIIFGWAKPVPVDARNLRNPRRDMAIVALAGPVSNLVMAFIWAGIAKLGMTISVENAWAGVPLTYMGEAGIMINVVLGILNLIPIPPLDGGRVLTSLLPPRAAWKLSQLEPYSFLILVLLLISGFLSYVISPPIMFLIRLIAGLFNLQGAY